MGYARQDRKAKARDPISAKLVADLISTAGGVPCSYDGLTRGADTGLFQYPS